MNSIFEQLSQKNGITVSSFEFADALIENSLDAIYAFDTDYRFILWNRAMEKFSGIRKEEVIGKIAMDLTGVKERKVDENFTRALRGESFAIPIITSFSVERGMDVSYIGSYFPIKDVDKNVVGGMAIIHDITDLIYSQGDLKESNEKLKEVMNLAKFAMWERDIKTGILHWPDFIGREIFEMDSPKVLTFDTLQNYVHPDDREYVKKVVIERMERQSEQFSYEYRIFTEKGNLKYLSGNFKPVFDTKGNLIKLRGFVQDISNSKINEALLRSVLDNSFNGVLLCKPIYSENQLVDFECILANPMAGKLVGKPEQEIVGSMVIKDLNGGSPDYIFDLFKESYENNISKKFERFSEIRNKHFEVQASKVNQHLMITFIDNTECKLMQNELEQKNLELEQKVDERTRELSRTNDQLKRINSDLDNFIYTASHDLKAPVSNIEGLIHTLEGTLSAEAEDVQLIMGMIMDSVKRFKSTINELTDISKVTKEFQGEDPEINNVQVLVQEICNDTLRNLIQETKAEVQEDYTIKNIFFSKKNLRSILYNLISNCIKYRAFHRTPVIKIKTEVASDNQLLISISDNGLGIKKGDLDKIFYMFKRLHDHVEGTGVGLYIVKKIVENSGGKIEVESELGKGTTFRIYIKHNLKS